MKYFLIVSLLINVWFQFTSEILSFYVRSTYCTKNQGVSSYGWNEYSILDFNILHIPKLYSPIGCMDGTEQKIK